MKIINVLHPESKKTAWTPIKKKLFKTQIKYWSVLILLGLILYGTWDLIFQEEPFHFVSPEAEAKFITITQVEYLVKESSPAQEPEDALQSLDVIIGNAVDEFFVSPYTRSAMRATMHCLASKESSHYQNQGHGDNGLAGGPFQFHQDTWMRMRRSMMQDGYANFISNRYSLKESARTTAYAFSKGWAKEWGPILRHVNNSGGATCELPDLLK